MVITNPRNIKAIHVYCRDEGRLSDIWIVFDIFILITGVVANAALLWLFLQERKSLSASQVLGMNLVAMDLIFLSIMPVSLYYDTQEDRPANHSDVSATDWESYNTAFFTQVDEARDIFSMFNLIGCPLLLACMCIERYLAVVMPVLYLRMRKLEYRLAVCTVVWCVTLSFCMATGILNNLNIIMMPVSLIISCLFILMLACLGGVVWSLQQQSPAHTTSGNQAHFESPLKRRAVGNVLAVVVPTVMSYLPVLAMFLVLLYIYYSDNSLNRAMCYISDLSVLFPKFGVLIGPLFYLSKARQMC